MHFKFVYVILDIMDYGSDAEQTAGLAQRRGKDAPVQCRGPGRSGIPFAQITERREPRSAAFAAHAIDRVAMPRTPYQRRKPTWRIIYHVAADAVAILDVFSKKTAATPKEVSTNCKRRLAAYIRAASGAKGKPK